MKKNAILSFIGMDGTGKTTLARATKNYLQSNGLKCKCMWFRYDCSVFFSSIVVAIAWLILGRKRPVAPHIHKNSALVRLLQFSLTFDYAFYSLCNVSIPRLFGFAVVCDRYIYDVLARLRFLAISNNGLERVLLAVTPRPEIIFLLDAPAEVAFDRKKEASLEFYQEQREIYRKILNNKGLNCIVINTAEDYLKTSKRIFGLIESIK